MKDEHADVHEVALDFEREQCAEGVEPDTVGLSAAEGARLESELHECFQLPDGTFFSAGRELSRAAEGLFQPQFIGMHKEVGIHQLMRQSIMACDGDMQKVMAQNVLLCGGAARMPSLQKRLQCDVAALVPGLRVDVTAPPSMKPTQAELLSDNVCMGETSALKGGSIVSSMSGFQQMWITKQDYEDEGPRIVGRKCW